MLKDLYYFFYKKITLKGLGILLPYTQSKKIK